MAAVRRQLSAVRRLMTPDCIPESRETSDGQTSEGAEGHSGAYRSRVPPLVAGATTLPGGKHVTGFAGRLQLPYESSSFATPRSSVGRQKESDLMGRLVALLRPTWRSYAGPPQGTIKLRYAVSCL